MMETSEPEIPPTSQTDKANAPAQDNQDNQQAQADNTQPTEQQNAPTEDNTTEMVTEEQQPQPNDQPSAPALDPSSSAEANQITDPTQAHESNNSLPVLPPSSMRERSRKDAPLICHIIGCKINLSTQAEYYQRYRICKAHLRCPALLVEDIPQRFCQQCGRFHPLKEFDGDKRNCRARLLQHNSRRRKVGTTVGIPPYGNQRGNLRSTKSVGSQPENRIFSERIRKRKLAEAAHGHAHDDDYIYGDDYGDDWRDDPPYDPTGGLRHSSNTGSEGAVDVFQELANAAAIHQQQLAPTTIRSRPIPTVHSAPGTAMNYHHPQQPPPHMPHPHPVYSNDPLQQQQQQPMHPHPYARPLLPSQQQQHPLPMHPHPSQLTHHLAPPQPQPQHYPAPGMDMNAAAAVRRFPPYTTTTTTTTATRPMSNTGSAPWIPPPTAPPSTASQPFQHPGAPLQSSSVAPPGAPPPQQQDAITSMLVRHYSDPQPETAATTTSWHESLPPHFTSAIGELERAIGRNIVQALLHESGLMPTPPTGGRLASNISASAMDILQQMVGLHAKNNNGGNSGVGGQQQQQSAMGMRSMYQQQQQQSGYGQKMTATGHHLAATVPRSGYLNHNIPSRPYMHPNTNTNSPIAMQTPSSPQNNPMPLNPFMQHRDAMLQRTASGATTTNTATTTTSGGHTNNVPQQQPQSVGNGHDATDKATALQHNSNSAVEQLKALSNDIAVAVATSSAQLAPTTSVPGNVRNDAASNQQQPSQEAQQTTAAATTAAAANITMIEDTLKTVIETQGLSQNDAHVASMAKSLMDPQNLDSFIKVLEVLKSQSMSAGVMNGGGGGGDVKQEQDKEMADC